MVGHKLNVVMEYAPFGDLRYYITKGIKLRAPFPEEAVWRIFLQLCRCVSLCWLMDALMLAHQHTLTWRNRSHTHTCGWVGVL